MSRPGSTGAGSPPGNLRGRPTRHGYRGYFGYLVVAKLIFSQQGRSHSVDRMAVPRCESLGITPEADGLNPSIGDGRQDRCQFGQASAAWPNGWRSREAHNAAGRWVIHLEEAVRPVSEHQVHDLAVPNDQSTTLLICDAAAKPYETPLAGCRENLANRARHGYRYTVGLDTQGGIGDRNALRPASHSMPGLVLSLLGTRFGGPFFWRGHRCPFRPTGSVRSVCDIQQLTMARKGTLRSAKGLDAEG